MGKHFGGSRRIGRTIGVGRGVRGCGQWDGGQDQKNNLGSGEMEEQVRRGRMGEQIRGVQDGDSGMGVQDEGTGWDSRVGE